MKEIKNPLVANIDRSEGEIEISIAKKYSKTEAPVFEKFMGMCAMYDTYAVDTSKEDDKGTQKACASLYDSEIQGLYQTIEANLFGQKPKHMLAGLSEKQKKNLPVELQKAIINKMKSEGKITDDMDASLFTPKGDTAASLFSPKSRPGGAPGSPRV